MEISEGRVFQAEGTSSAKVLWWKISQRIAKRPVSGVSEGKRWRR